jgi:hypothetical protein
MRQEHSEPRAVWILPPLDHTDSKAVDQREKLVFSRRFDGRPGGKDHYEVFQTFTHLFDLHFMEERQAPGATSMNAGMSRR